MNLLHYVHRTVNFHQLEDHFLALNDTLSDTLKKWKWNYRRIESKAQFFLKSSSTPFLVLAFILSLKWKKTSFSFHTQWLHTSIVSHNFLLFSHWHKLLHSKEVLHLKNNIFLISKLWVLSLHWIVL
jgi:hypothetical protein